ncbi:unnamed protein product [Peronospora belbahrii]|uniref:Urocanate hydratase n=1 Tax=Peronospora belbahrii TaxID=622444 RepID=A0AAU9KLJ0_9STRA|nr:unnamed protein product [Peronospora belbahrii]
MHHFRPVQYEMKAYSIDMDPAKCPQATSIMLMIMNNLDRRVFQNWAQYLLTMRYLSELTEHQTLVMYSGHPMGLFPSRPAPPRMVVTNGLMIPNYSTRMLYDKAYAMGNTQYGARRQLRKNTRGTVYVSSGLGGMSGAQPKAGVISGVISVTAEINEAAVRKRREQGWVNEAKGEVVNLAYHGNVFTLWERLAHEAETTGELLVKLGSDQTLLHNPFNGGYYPVQLTFGESQRVMAQDPMRFQDLVQESLRRHTVAVNRLTAKASWCEARGGCCVHHGLQVPELRARHHGGYFLFGIWLVPLGPGASSCSAPQNLRWIEAAEDNELVVGSEARILYADRVGRGMIAMAFNDTVASGEISAPVVLSRDHHDNALGDAARGATWITLHNGGGVGWGEVMNGGFGMVLDGSDDAREKAGCMLSWDVNNGVARRAWARNANARFAIDCEMKADPLLTVTLANEADDDTVRVAVSKLF